MIHLGQLTLFVNRAVWHNVVGDIIMNRLKELRKLKGYTQLQIQMKTGIDQSDYSKIENGVRYMTLEQCKRLALILDTSMDYLAGITNNPKPYERNK